MKLDRFILERAEYSIKDFSQFQNNNELISYIVENDDYPIYNIPLIMLNNVMLLITLADEMDKVSPRRKSSSIFFIIVCIESVYNFIPAKPLQLQERPIKFFNNYSSPEDKKLIEEGISIGSVGLE
ncbi:hypothetical protein PTI45_00964 [Paenibacillus nuruki]|uniref:Uncharacterized protein n=1 Tax=Paenibacillus nuruki TaxID=1886670 RepID=A0A1E3L799_9BACL|nr:hypothetical protein [Paenibacillus nuruki]ODP29481.1 hypothetical protein PTI45_00964 [Paenibacillus nuruki]